MSIQDQEELEVDKLSIMIIIINSNSCAHWRNRGQGWTSVILEAKVADFQPLNLS